MTTKARLTVAKVYQDYDDLACFVIRPADPTDAGQAEQAEATARALQGHFDDFGGQAIPGWVVHPPTYKGAVWRLTRSGALAEIWDNGINGYSHRNLTPQAGSCVLCLGGLDAEADMPGEICSGCWAETFEDDS